MLNTQRKLQELIWIYGADCVYCGKSPANTIDHIIPQSSGWGKSSSQNMLPACKLCNSKKRDNDIFIYATCQQITQIDSIRINHGISSLINLKQQYLAWKDSRMNNNIFAINFIQTGKMTGAADNVLFSRLRTLIGLYFVMIDNQQLDKAKEILDTVFTSNDYEEIYKQHAIGNLEMINQFVRNKKLKDIVTILRDMYKGYSNNNIPPAISNVVKGNKDSLLEQVVAKYDVPQETLETVVEKPSITYLSNILAEIIQVSNVIKKLRDFEKERAAVEQQILHYQHIKNRIDKDYQQLINNLECGDELVAAIISKLQAI